MFEQLGRLVTAHPWKVIALWVVAAALIVPLSPRLSDVSNADQSSFLPAGKESMQAQELAKQGFATGSGATGIFVVRRSGGGRLTAAQRREVTSLARTLDRAGIPAVDEVTTSAEQLADNRTAQLVSVSFSGQPSDAPVEGAVAALRDRADRALAGTGLEAQLTGDAAVLVDTKDSFGAAEQITFLATLLLIVVLVGSIFRSPVAAFLPILTIGVVYTLATALVAVTAKLAHFEVDQSLTTLLIVVLFGIGTDYILFLLFRYRERLRAGDESRAAVAFSVARVGQAVASSASVVIAAFLAMLLAQLGFLSAMAPGLAISVAVMLLAGLTLVPAVMAVLGPRLFWPSKRWRRAPENALFKRGGKLIARRPGWNALASGGVLVALAACSLFFASSYQFELPAGTESSQALERIRAAFPAGASSPTEVYLRDPRGVTTADTSTLARRLAAVDGVASVAKPALSGSGTIARIEVTLDREPTSNAAMATVAGPLRDAAHAAGVGVEVRVGGETSAYVDLRDTINRDMSVVFPVAAAIIALILALLLRSLVAPLYLLAAVSLGFAATLGAGVLIFQGAAGDAGLLFMLPIMLYLFVVAIGTDYNILMTTRLREEVVEGGDARRSADLSVEHAGPTVAAAGVILAGTFASLTLTGISFLVQMGATIAIGVVLVSMVMATGFVPSLAALLGRGVWWPGHRAEVSSRSGRRARGRGRARRRAGAARS